MRKETKETMEPDSKNQNLIKYSIPKGILSCKKKINLSRGKKIWFVY